MTSAVPPPIMPYAPRENAYALYTPRAVGLATFLGSPLAGSVIMAMNYRRLGNPRAGRIAIACGAVGTVLLCLFGAVTRNQPVSLGIGLATIMLMAGLTQSLQGTDIDKHWASGGAKASSWKAAGVGLIGLVVMLALIVAVMFVSDEIRTRSRVVFGGGEVFYSGGSTNADAQKLGQFLVADGYFDPRRRCDVFIAKGGGVLTVKLIVNPNAIQKPNMITAFTALGYRMKTVIGGPFTLKLVDPRLNELKSIPIAAGSMPSGVSPLPQQTPEIP